MKLGPVAFDLPSINESNYRDPVVEVTDSQQMFYNTTVELMECATPTAIKWGTTAFDLASIDQSTYYSNLTAFNLLSVNQSNVTASYLPPVN